MSVRDTWQMQCPKCGLDDHLDVTAVDFKWRKAAVDKRIKTRKVRGGVHVTIMPPVSIVEAAGLAT